MPKTNPAKAAAWKFIIFVGIVSLFSDFTYEGARSISGPFLGALGASATVVGVVAGLGEFIGYTLRLGSGFLTDRLRLYWPIALAGYAVNLLAVPVLALAGSWEVAALLLIAERAGKGLRNPARDAMLSHAASQVGQGAGFGLHRAMDQAGAVLGPLAISGVLLFKGTYRTGFAILLAPALIALAILAAGPRLYPNPERLEPAAQPVAAKGFSRPYWLYVLAVSLIGAGYADFALIAYHFHQAALMPANLIPLVYALAMGVDAGAALICGRLFDRLGLAVTMAAAFLAAFFAPLVFLGGMAQAFVGMALWGVGMGVQQSIMRAAVAHMVQSNQRASAYGTFQAVFGVFWFGGSALMGVLYDFSLPALIAFSMGVQVLSIPTFFLVSREICFVPPSAPGS